MKVAIQTRVQEYIPGEDVYEENATFSPFGNGDVLFVFFAGFICAAHVIQKRKYDEGDVRKRIKTGNAQESSFSPAQQVHKELKRTSRTIGIFLNDGSGISVLSIA